MPTTQRIGLTYNQAFLMLAKGMRVRPDELKLLHPNYDIDDYMAGHLERVCVGPQQWAEINGRHLPELAVDANPEEGMATFHVMVVQADGSGKLYLKHWEVSMSGVVMHDD